MSGRAEKKIIAILGAGFGGLRAARLLAKGLRRHNLLGKYEVLLFDRSHYHLYTPLLYEVATTSEEIAGIASLHSVTSHPLHEIIHDTPVRIVIDEIISIDAARGSIITKTNGVFVAEYIILALGSEANYFNIPGLKEYALPLKTFNDAIKIRDAILNRVTGATGNIKVVVAGGGSTGVEIAGEISVWARALKKQFPAMTIKTSIVEGNSTLLPGFAPVVVKKIEKRLARLGVQYHTGNPITNITDTTLVLENGGGVEYDVLIWTGGVRVAKAVSSISFKTEVRGRPEAQSTMTCLPQTPHLNIRRKIYAVGDNVCFYDPKTGNPVPGVARAALSQAAIAAHNIVEDILVAEGKKTKPGHKDYKPMQYPYVLPTGGKYAVAKLGPFVISGFFGWLLKGIVEINYLVSIMPLPRALRIWLKGLWIFMRNDRLG